MAYPNVPISEGKPIDVTTTEDEVRLHPTSMTRFEGVMRVMG